jgi:hypothetical protein
MNLNDEFVDIFAEHLHLSKDDIIKMANGIENRSFHSLKVNQIKDIIRIFKNRGHYNLSTTPNKPQLIESLISILNNRTVDITSQERHIGGQSISDARIAEHQRQIQIQQSRQYQLAEQQRQQQAQRQAQLQQQAYIAQMQQRAMANGAPQEGVHSIINTPLKRQVYDDLMRQPGLTRDEVLREIAEACSGGSEDDLDADMLMFNIVTRREQDHMVSVQGGVVDWEALQEEALKQREDADMDRAILESEQERDVIQVAILIRSLKEQSTYMCILYSKL